MSTLYSLEDWAQEHGYSMRQAWRRCPRGDFMLCWAGPRVERRELVLAACECARLTLHLVPNDEPAARVAIETAEACARGDDSVTQEDVRRAAADLTTCATVYVYYADHATYYAVAAAIAAFYTAYAADTPYYIYTPYAADYVAAASDDLEKALRECATICRRRWSTLPEDL